MPGISKKVKKMAKIKWDIEKARKLLKERNIDFKKIAKIIYSEDFEIELSPNQEGHKGQKMFVIDYDGYACCVPFVLDEFGDIFLKTAFRSRKIQRRLKK